ncbi:MAG: nicotinate-nucleotide--dimethylbenzimidazole phosphoribosyltransferase [Magnetococcales bacterium]|nr:nicotinate-nucleotide--dimethylbenzimidazole phosphoribosyltransferase [Magnetococcales bacterium]
MPSWLNDPIPAPSASHMEEARRRQDQLTKPAGSLGRLEDLAVRLAGLQRRDRPTAERVRIVVFAGDHGVTAAGVSPFPQSVTLEMIRNFSRGGAAISVLARQLLAVLEVVDVGAAMDPGPLPGVIPCRVGAGTKDFRAHPAMDREELAQALQAGADAVARASLAGCDLFIGGEMGIGNTTAAAAMVCALLHQPAILIAGPGAGLDQAGVTRKAEVIDQALEHHARHLRHPLEIMAALGGFEIAALTGACVAAAQRGLPVLVDGFIVSTAALAAVQLRPEVLPWLIFAHQSAEPGHQAVLKALEAVPLLDLGMRLGEASGSAVAVPLLRLACALHGEMATFAEAGVSTAE